MRPVDQEQRYRELERRDAEALEVRVRRGKTGVLLALVLALLLAGVTGAVDLRRLQTPGGTAQRWSEATAFGDCDAALALSVPVTGDRRGRSELCRELRRRTREAGTRAPSTTVRTRLLSQRGRTAQVEAVVTTTSRRVVARVPLRRTDDGWRVVRDAEACRLGCG